MLTDDQIEAGKRDAAYGLDRPHHEHPDCIRMAYEWLDAQVKTKGAVRRAMPLKHHVEKWAGRYVSQTDVEVAAHLHPEIRGKYPYFNISSKLVRPHERRLEGIGQAKTQGYSEPASSDTYSSEEE